MDKTSDANFHKITYTQFVLSLMVIMIHTYNVDVYNIDGTVFAYFEQEISCLSRIAVPTFFAISGFLFFRNYDLSQTLNKWQRRIFSLVIPLVVWNVIAYLYYLVLSFIPFVSNNMNVKVNMPTTITDIISILFSTEYNNVAWYLVNLIVYVLFAPLIYLVLKNKYLGIIAILGMPLFGCIISNNYLIQSMYFMFGAYFGLHFRHIVLRKGPKKVGLLAAVAFLLLSQVLFLLKGNTTDYFSDIILLLMIPSLWVAVDCFDFRNAPKWWITISFYTYMIHSFILESIEKVILIAFGKNLAGSIIDYFVAPAVTFLIIVLSAYFLRTFCKPAWRLLTGSR